MINKIFHHRLSGKSCLKLMPIRLYNKNYFRITIWQKTLFPLKCKSIMNKSQINLQEKRLRIIEDCLISRLSRFEADKVLRENNLKELEGGEQNCYEIVFNCNIGKSVRDKIIAGCLLQGLSRTDANLEIVNNNYRRMDEKECENYDNYLSRIRYFGAGIFSKIKKEIILPSRDEIIKNAMINASSADNLNQKLSKNGYKTLSDKEDEKYRKDCNEYHLKRQNIIRKAYEKELTLPQVNKILSENNQAKLSFVEELDFQKEREKLQSKRRKNLIKECIEERMNLRQINLLLNNNNFEQLSEQEYDKLKYFISNDPKANKLKTSELSDQFRKLYRNATKKYHPDRFNEKSKKEQATIRMKEINEAKEKNDYFLLKDLLQKYDEQDEKNDGNS